MIAKLLRAAITDQADVRRVGMERIVDRPGALDVHQASVMACVRVWHERELEEHVAEFATTVHGLLALRDWLEALGVSRDAMEATGVYWRPVVRHEALFDRVVSMGRCTTVVRVACWAASK